MNSNGIILRSKVNWYEYGEKSSKYFLSLEKRNKAKSHLRKVVKTNEQETSDIIEIFIQACTQGEAIRQKMNVLLTLEGLISPNLLMMREMFVREN